MADGIIVPTKKVRFLNEKNLETIPLMPLSVRWHLNAHLAALMNGHACVSTKVVSIGAGALGSQITNNLWRGGFGEWVIADGDNFDAHNPARHLFDSQAVGLPKANVQAQLMQAVFPDRPAPSAIVCDYLSPGKNEALLTTALKEAGLILDFSASVTVERALSVDTRSEARRMSAFLNQRGDESVMLVEDVTRKNRLIWLEALYYRAVATEPLLTGHFDEVDAVAHRYGNGCREISAVVPQDGVALHAGLLAHAIRLAAEDPKASIIVRRWSPRLGSVTAVEVFVAEPLVITTADWTILIDPIVVRGIAELRAKYLPKETGGVLVGVVDRSQLTISVTGLIPAPSDSIAWPTSFIRGSNGLAAAVRRLGVRSLGNIVYVGEWHSHPDACDATPSMQDVAAVSLCSANTRADGLPALMMIVAKPDIGFVIQPLNGDKLYVTKIPHPKS
jgi:integrative and conjugative element protein (TIGR02256 family)